MAAVGKEPVSRVADYVETIVGISEKFEIPDGPWFRGINDQKHSILPGAYWRANVREWEVATEFKSQAPVYMRHDLSMMPISSENPWEWYFLMQHFGLPTRLLDWTENPLVALFFATKSDPEDDGTPCVWVLNPNRLNETTIQDPNVIVPSGEFTDNWLYMEGPDVPSGCKPGSPRAFEWSGQRYSNQYPIAIYPVRSNPRIIAQQGVFTVHGAERIGIEEVLAPRDRDGPKDALFSIPIRRDAVPRIRSELESLGVRWLALFPELPNLAEAIKKRLGITP